MFAATLALALPLTLGNTLRVGPTQAFATIGDAVTAAVSGDMIVVDPGSYPPFTVDGKGLTIVSSSGTYQILESGGNAAILVRNVADPDQVTIADARIDHGAVAQPAVHVVSNSGTVRFSNVRINLVTQRLGVTAHGVIEAIDTDPLWLEDVRVRTSTSYRASRAGATGWDSAVNGIYIYDTNAILKEVQTIGYDAGVTHAGDGLRVEGNSTAWLVDNITNSPTRSIYAGGDGDYGGSAIQAFGQRWNNQRVTSCGPVSFHPGDGVSQKGGIYAVNGDGSVVPGPFAVQRRPNGCRNIDYIEVSVASHEVSYGSSFQLTLFAIEAAPYYLVASTLTDYQRNFLGLRGRSIIDTAPLTSYLISQGVTRASVAQRMLVNVPNDPTLIGKQLSFQAAIADTRVGLVAFSMPTFIVVTP